MKYIDLHLHLDGAITVPIAKKLAALQDISLPADTDDALDKLLRVPEDCTSLNDFLKCFELPLTLLQTRDGLSEAVYLVLEKCSEDGVVYAEVRFAPQLHTQGKMSQEDAVLAALDGLNHFQKDHETSTDTPFFANLILCCMRGNGNNAENQETVRLAEKYLVKTGGVVAIDLAGAEALFPTSDFQDIFSEAQNKNIPFTIHAGEADGPESIRTALEFGAARIGHGVHAFEDSELTELLAKKHIPLEMCPTSNRQTHAVDDMNSYPLRFFLDRGIPVTINTDDPAIEGTSIKNEFDYIKKLYSINDDEIRTLLLNSVNAAFTTEDVKQKLINEVLNIS